MDAMPDRSSSPVARMVFSRLIVYRLVQSWLVALVQVHKMTALPLAVALPLTSRHRPDCTLLIVPLALRFHCWFVPPWQSHSCAFAPAEALVGASRHLPRGRTVWPVNVQPWLSPPLQSQMTGWVPLAVLLPGTSRHR